MLISSVERALLSRLALLSRFGMSCDSFVLTLRLSERLGSVAGDVQRCFDSDGACRGSTRDLC